MRLKARGRNDFSEKISGVWLKARGQNDFSAKISGVWLKARGRNDFSAKLRPKVFSPFKVLFKGKTFFLGKLGRGHRRLSSAKIHARATLAHMKSYIGVRAA